MQICIEMDEPIPLKVGEIIPIQPLNGDDEPDGPPAYGEVKTVSRNEVILEVMELQ